MKRFYVWVELGRIGAAWLIHCDKVGVTDCTDMSDEEFQKFILHKNDER